MPQDSNVKDRAEERNGEQRRVVVEEQIDVRPSVTAEVTRPGAEQFSVIIGILTGTEKDRSHVECRGIDQTEENRQVVKKHFPPLTAKEVRTKNQQVPFEAGEGHEKEIDDVQGVVKPVPEGAEGLTGGRDVRGEEIRLRKRESESDEQKRDEEKNEDHVVTERFPQVWPVRVLKKGAEKSQQGNHLQDKKDAELDSVGLNDRSWNLRDRVGQKTSQGEQRRHTDVLLDGE